MTRERKKEMREEIWELGGLVIIGEEQRRRKGVGEGEKRLKKIGEGGGLPYDGVWVIMDHLSQKYLGKKFTKNP